MDSILEFLWVGFFLGSFVVARSRKGNGPIVVGLVGLGVPGLITFLFRSHTLPLDFVDPLRPVLQLAFPVSAVLIAYGVVKLLSGQSSGMRALEARPLLDSAGTNLASLFTPRNNTNSYSRAEVLRDKLSERLVRSASSLGLRPIEQKSNAHSPTVWLRLDYQLPHPQPELSLRAYLLVTIERFDFHRFEHLYSIQFQVGTELRAFSGVIDLDDETVERIHRYVARTGARLRVPNRVRELPWQLWRPANKVERLGVDWVGILGAVGATVLFVIPAVGWVLGIGAVVALYWRKRHRRTYVLTTGKPATDPRSLRWMDSWQATVAGLGPMAVQVSDGIMSRIAASAPNDLSIGVEHIGYWGVDSRVERDQVAIRYRRALAFVQIVPYGPNLYVAWECHLNLAVWNEQTLARGVDRGTGLDVHANRVVPGYMAMNEYDVADANFLSEWVHLAVKQVMKLKMAEYQVDQEIDFTVQHESRKEALGAPQAAPAAPSRLERGRRFRRVA